MNKKKIIIVIPAYQPDEKLIQLVEQLKEYKVVVVNDGSGDIYHEVFAQSKKAGAKVLSYSKNRGKGYALKHVFRRIANSDTYVEWIITADADGQHKVSDIVRLIDNTVSGEKGLLIGTRRFQGYVPLRSRIGNVCMNKVFGKVTGVKLLDTQSGLRAYHIELLPRLCEIKGNRYEYEMNCLLWAAQNNVKIRQIPIDTIYEEGNGSSHFKAVRDSLRICGWMIISLGRGKYF